MDLFGIATMSFYTSGVGIMTDKRSITFDLLSSSEYRRVITKSVPQSADSKHAPNL